MSEWGVTPLEKKEEKPVYWLPEDARTSIHDKHRQKPVWEEAPLNVGADLHPYIRRLLGAADSAGETTHARTFRLAQEARRLLIEGEPLGWPSALPAAQRKRKFLVIVPGTAAKARIAARVGSLPGGNLQFHFDDLRLVFFRTGHAFVMAEVVFSRSDGALLHPYWIVEGIHSLGRFNSLYWEWAQQSKAASEPNLKGQFSLGEIVRAITDGGETSRRERRVYTATYIKFAATPQRQDARRLALQLAHHYTDDYRTVARPEGVKFLASFENLLHAFSLEGCATLVDPTAPPGLQPPVFLNNFKTQTYEPHYLPIVLLAFHEFNTLLHLTNDSSFWPELASVPAKPTSRLARLRRRIGTLFRRKDKSADSAGAPLNPIDRLVQLRDQILKFRLCYRFTYVSQISLHNEANRALCEVLGLDWMLAELDRDTREIEAYLQTAIAKLQAGVARRTAQRFRWASIIGAAALAWLTTFVIVKEFLHVLHEGSKEASWMAEVLHAVHLESEGRQGIAAVVVSVIVGLMTGWITWSRTRGGHTQGHLIEHAIEEHIRHKALD